MKIIGITGKSGSGKTTFSSLLAKNLGCKHIDVDKIGHQALLNPDILGSLKEKFGTEILNENGLDRKKIGDVVFTQRNKMKDLSDLTWKFMQHQLDSILSQDDEIIVLEWILLPHSKYWKECNYKILIVSSDDARKNKVIERDHVSEEYFQKRESASIDYSQISFDYIFENDYQPATMEKYISSMLTHFQLK